MMESGPMLLKFRPGLRLSDRTFARLCRANPELRLERTAKGELIVMAPAGSDSGRLNFSLAGQFWDWHKTHKLGVFFDSSAGFTLPNTAIRSPDVSWMARDRWDSIPKKDRKRFSHVCPDFVAELRSPSDSLADLREKMREYIDQGARLGWLIDPETRRVEIYRPEVPPEELDDPPTLSGEDVLPGFVLDMKALFDMP